MNTCYYTANRPDGSTLYLAPLTSRRIEAADLDIDDPSGLYLYEHRGSQEAGSVKVIARVMSPEAALMFRELFGMT